MTAVNFPVACSLTSAELQERQERLLKKVRSEVAEIKELENGFAYKFPAGKERITELAQLIDLEHQCCPFLRFQLTVESDDGHLWLEMTGPEGTKDFLAEVFK
jgi:hypothetical protein